MTLAKLEAVKKNRELTDALLNIRRHDTWLAAAPYLFDTPEEAVDALAKLQTEYTASRILGTASVLKEIQREQRNS